MYVCYCFVLAVNMVNGMSVNGLGEVSMDTTQTVISSNLIANNLIALGKNFLIFNVNRIVLLFKTSKKLIMCFNLYVVYISCNDTL